MEISKETQVSMLIKHYTDRDDTESFISTIDEENGFRLHIAHHHTIERNHMIPQDAEFLESCGWEYDKYGERVWNKVPEYTGRGD